MNTIQTPLIITGIRSKVDMSLGITCSTPELSTEERALFMELQGLNLKAIFKPTEEKTAIKEIKGDLETKTPSQILRNRLFVLWRERKEKGEFDSFYRKWMNKFGEIVLEKIDQTK